MKTLLRPFFGCAVLAATGVMVTMVAGENFDCQNYNPNICTLDAIMFCLTNGTIVTGRCHAMRAVCVEKRTLDPTFAACGHHDNTKFDCEQYKANPFVCTKDLVPFCLANGTVVRGTCNAKQAVCKENQQLVDDFSACNKAGAGPNSNDQQTDDDSAATVACATVSLLVSSLLSAAFLL